MIWLQAATPRARAPLGWRERSSGSYRLRLDGFNYLRNVAADSLQEVFLLLAGVAPAQVEEEAGQFYAKIREALKNAPLEFDASAVNLPDFSELAAREYFEAAKGAMLRELAPLVQDGQN